LVFSSAGHLKRILKQPKEITMFRNYQKGIFLIAFFAILFGSCNIVEDVPDFNNPSLEQLTDSPTRVSINTLATGLLIGSREGIENYVYMT